MLVKTHQRTAPAPAPALEGFSQQVQIQYIEGDVTRPVTTSQAGLYRYGIVAHLYVANMIAQHDIANPNAPRSAIPPIRYDALISCLVTLADFANNHQLAIHMPRIGAGLAGGNWVIIEQLLFQYLRRIPVYIYSL